jgi:N6-adenosine-specific RNA methylase IME4
MSRYRTIVADPPWAYEDGFGGFNGRPKAGPRVEVRRGLPYEPMTVDAIAALPLCDLADEDGANIFLWTTNRYLPAAFDVLTAWGATYRQALVWFKTGANPLTGSVAPTACEFLLFARIGAGAGLTGKWPDPLVVTKRPGPNSHSAKPEGFLDRIEQVSPGPYVELFARRARFGWDYWGDQSLGTASMEAA